MKIRLDFEKEQKNIEQYKKYKAKARRRLCSSQPHQQQQHIDCRNLWKATSINQQKQYKAIRQSGIMDPRRKVTFFKFNYRHSEEKNIEYQEVYKSLFEDSKRLQQNKYRLFGSVDPQANKKIRIKKDGYIPLTKQLTDKIQKGRLDIRQFFNPIKKKSKFGAPPASFQRSLVNSDIDTIKSELGTQSDLKYQSKKNPSIKKLEETKEEMLDFFDEYWEPIVPKQDIQSSKQCEVFPGTMNVCDVWGQKHLKQNLGFLPCVRDRPRLLKAYANKINPKLKEKQTEKNLKKCITES